MNPTPTDTEAAKQANPASDAHAPRQASPVMDVVPPRPAEKFLTPSAPAATSPTPTAKPAASAPIAGGLATPPPETEDEKSSHDATKAKTVGNTEASKPVPVKPKPAGNSVAGIIALTVCVVTILSGLAVYAYLQSQQ